MSEFTVLESFEVTNERDDKTGKKVINGYKKIKTLGRGAYSKVNHVVKQETNEDFAMKIIDKRALERKNRGFFKDENGDLVVNSLLQDSLKEIAILKKLNHEHVVKLHEIMHDEERGKIYLMTEYLDLGTIMNFDEFTGEFDINEHFSAGGKKAFYSEDEIMDFARNIVTGIDYLHTNGIIHRDIKPDNILVNSRSCCKITDFNVSAMLEGNQDKVGKNMQGTMYFMAPECCSGKPLDVWALGVTVFVLTYKELPFLPDNPENIIELMDKIATSCLELPLTREVSDELQDFFVQTLEKNPFKRITIEELKDHPWLNLNREPLANRKAKRVTVSDTEMKHSMQFFTNLQIAKKVGLLWKKKSLNSKRRSTQIVTDKSENKLINQKFY